MPSAGHLQCAWTATSQRRSVARGIANQDRGVGFKRRAGRVAWVAAGVIGEGRSSDDVENDGAGRGKESLDAARHRRLVDDIRAAHFSRGTASSNPLPSSGESHANHRTRSMLPVSRRRGSALRAHWAAGLNTGHQLKVPSNRIASFQLSPLRRQLAAAHGRPPRDRSAPR